MNVTLPKKPIDRYEVIWFVADLHGNRVSSRRAIYHVNNPWREVCPDHWCEDGADFVNEWQMFVDDRFCGRSDDGWEAVTKFSEYPECHPTLRKAAAALLKGLSVHLASLREQAETTSEAIVKWRVVARGAGVPA